MAGYRKLHAVLAAAGLAGMCIAGAAGATNTNTISIDPDALHAAGCFGLASCEIDGVQLSAVGGALARKSHNGRVGFGVNGGSAGAEIDIGEKLVVDFGQPRSVVAIKFLFLYNGPEFGDKAEKASVKADGVTYTLSVRRTSDDAPADWSGPGTVTKCGATTSTGSGCFLIENPFPGNMTKLEFQAIHGGPPFSGSGSSNSDYALGFIDVAAQTIVELADCADPAGCPVATVNGNVAFSLSSMQVANPGGSTEALVVPVQFPDCRYVPQACLALLPPAGDSAATDDAAREILIGLGVIRPLDPGGPYRLNPAAQALIVNALLPAEVTSLFDASGTPPGGLPRLEFGPRLRGQAGKEHRVDAFFFKTDPTLLFSGTFDGLVDVEALTGSELGCAVNPSNLLAVDIVTTTSELALGAGGRYGDTPVNVGCINPSKIKGSRLSLDSIMEVAPDTFGPTIKSWRPKVTVANDAVFARLVQSLWHDLGDVRARFACRQADPSPSGGVAPLSSAACKKLASLWSIANFKIDLCVASAFHPSNSYQAWICGLAERYVADFRAAIPAVASGPDPYNRRSELDMRTEVFQYFWTERFLESIEPQGYCREKGTCPP